MKPIRFDEQSFQLAAINAVADVFEGQYAADSQKLVTLQAKWAQEGQLLAGLEQDFTIRGNSLQVSDELLARNARTVQEHNGIELPTMADTLSYGRNYTIEMETGTGKTYVYVRTALELARRYGWRKFMIVVPSIAIKEGVANSIETMRTHLESIYDDIGHFNASVYNSRNTGAIGDYARSEDVELLITTIDSFKRQDTHMNREQEDLGWQKPIDVLAHVQPVVIIDEPQSNMGLAGKAAIERINALCTLRYSATHRRGEYYNLMYQLSPVDAHKQNLVKTVYVRSAGLAGAASKPYIKLLDIRTRPTGGPEAKLELDKRVKGTVQKKQQWVKDNADLEQLTENDAYRGYVLDGISAREGAERISFEASSQDLYVGDSIGGFNDDVMRAQIRATITAHLERERSLRDKGIKVLSLFFVDKVASYWEVDEAGNYSPGKIQRWFVEELKEQLATDRYKDLYAQFELSQLYDAYFSILRKKKAGTEQFVDEDSATSTEYKAAEAEAFERIMKDKEGLLDAAMPLRFIFSHSALKEGWDNPNVFQICMMRDANSPLDRRQTIGRGLRLPVDQNGVRSFDKTINQLTVIANESYEEFAANLQKEYVSEGVVFGKLRSNAFAKLLNDEGTEIGFETSKTIWQCLVDNGFVTLQGELTPKFTPGVIGFDLQLPADLHSFDTAVQDVMQDYQLKNIVKEDKPVRVTYSKQILHNQAFNELWRSINQKTTYRVDFSTEEVIARAAELVKNMPHIKPVRVVMKEGKLQYTQGGIDGQDVAGERTMSIVDVVEVPDIISFLQRETNLTRKTLAEILLQSGRLNDLLVNPTEFKFAALTCIREVTQAVQVEKISYHTVEGDTMTQRQLEKQLEQEVIRQFDTIYKVQRADRTLSDYIPIDSEVEKGFARKLDEDPNVEVFVKLPGDYKIPTPFGNYNPDWAYVYNLDGERRLHLVRETKHTTNESALQRDTEKAKVACARVHYAAIDVDYALATDASPLISV